MIALGIDPGTRRAGFGVLEVNSKEVRLIEAGLLHVKSTDKPTGLVELSQSLEELILTHHPEVFGIEKLFFVRNQKTGMAVAEARGALLSVAKRLGLTIKEFAPSEIKLRVTGYGSADKAAVARMMRLLLHTPKLKLIDDAMDALAIAWCAAEAARSPHERKILDTPRNHAPMWKRRRVDN